MSLASNQIQAFISYCSPVQDRIVGANTGVYKSDSVVRALHVYKTLWTSPLIDEML